MLGAVRGRLHADQNLQHVEIEIVAAAVRPLFGEAAGDLERPEQENIDVLGEEVAKDETQRESDGADDEPRAQLDEVLHQRRAGGLDLRFVAVEAHDRTRLAGETSDGGASGDEANGMAIGNSGSAGSSAVSG